MLQVRWQDVAVRDMVLSVIVVTVFAGLTVAAFTASRELSALAVVPLALPAGICVGLLVLWACAGSGPALLTYFAILVFVNDALFRTREAGEIGLDWQNAMKFALWGGAAAIGLCHLGAARRMALSPPFLLGFVYAAYAMVSSLYSEAFAYSFGTAFGVLAMILLALAVSVRLEERQILLTCTLTLWLFVLIGWLVYYAVPDLGRSPFLTVDNELVERICGIAGQANALGRVLAIMLGLVFLLWYRGQCGLGLALPIVVTGLVTIMAADSRSSLLALLIGIAAVLANRSLWSLAGFLLGGLVGVLTFLGIPLRELLHSLARFSRSGDPTEVFTLTGRTDIWTFAWDKIDQSPWIGYGYNSAKFILPKFLDLGIQIDDAHNMWLQSLLAGGIIGTIPLVLLFAWLLLRYITRPDPVRDLFAIMTLIYGITSSGAFGSTANLLTLMIFVGAGLAARTPIANSAARRNRAPPPPTPFTGRLGARA